MPHLLYDKSDGIARLTLNRPDKRNAMSPEMIVRLAEAWADAAADPAVRVALLTGAGDRAFSAGADLGRLIPLLTRARPADDEWDERLLADRSMFDAALLRNVTFFKPVVAAVNGPALAGGTEILLGCDVRVASSAATFGLTEVRRGIVPGGGSLARLARQVPWVAAMEMVLGGEPISAEEAWRIGLVNRVVAPSEVLGAAEEVARRIAKGAPVALAKAKEAIVRSNGRPLEEAFAIENDCARVVMRTEDAKEGPRAFMEKREPRFTGR